MDKGLDGRGIYRAIYTSIWDDPDFRTLTPNEKLILLNLRTSPHTNMPVIYPYYLEAIEKQTGLSKRAIIKAIDTLCHRHWIAIEDGIVWVIKGLKFDPNIKIMYEKHQTAIKKIVLGLPKLQIVRDFIDFYQIDIPYPIPSRDTMLYPIPKAMVYKDPEPEPDKDPEKEKEKEYEEEEKPKTKDLISSLSKSKNLNQFVDESDRRKLLKAQAEMMMKEKK